VGLQPSGGVHLSTDRGASWQALSLPTGTSYTAVAIADSTSRLLAAEGPNLHSSTDDGVSWSTHVSGNGLPWSDVTMDGPGVNANAVQDGGGELLASGLLDSGAWIESNLLGFSAAALSGDSGLLVLAEPGQPTVAFLDYVNSGTFGVRTITGAAPGLSDIALSTDGQRLLAADSAGVLFLSDNRAGDWSGVFWAGSGNATNISLGGAVSVAMSGNGEKLFAVSDAGLIAASIAHRTVPGVQGSLAGGRGDAVSLQYIGDGQYIVLNYTSNNGAFTIE
jgi:hypothetical protein